MGQILESTIREHYQPGEHVPQFDDESDKVYYEQSGDDLEMRLGADNYCVGSIGDKAVTLSPACPRRKLGQDLSHGVPVLPESLWPAQLLERFGMFKIYDVSSGRALSEDNNGMDQHTYGSQSQNDHWSAMSLDGGLYTLQLQLTGRYVNPADGSSGTKTVTVACTRPCSATSS